MKLFLRNRLVQCLLTMAVLGIANPQTLREAALARNILVGAAVRPSLFSEAAYSATLAREFNMVEARRCDEVVDREAHGWRVRLS